MDSATAPPRRRAGVEAYPLRLWDLLVLYRRNRDAAYSLNASAQAVWQLCDGRRSVQQIAEELERWLDNAAPGSLSAEVAAAVEEMTARGLLERS